VLREAILTAAAAGMAAALVLTVVQLLWVTPLILTGENYEERAESIAQGQQYTMASEHHHDVEAWKPQNGLERTLFSAGANLLLGIGYALILVAVFLFWRAPKTPLWGAAYGLAGFLTFFAAPALGLPPELPGTAAADLTARQEWWAMTTLATGGGFFLFFAQTRWWVRALAVALVIAPHLVSAPHPAVEGSLAPPDLQSRFRVATTLCNAAFWVVLGIFTSLGFEKLGVGNARAKV
jgi:cobalt transporter subunit CbtA